MLSKEFLDKYPDFPSHMGELSKFVYYRTYSRWLPEENRRETWKETCARAVDYNCSLAPIKEHEDEQLFDSMFNLKQFISGRSLWTGGSKAVEKAPLSGFNCAFVVVDSLQAFADLFYLLMVGTGVGFRILPTDVAKLPKFKDNVKLRCFYHADEPWGNPTTTLEHISDKSLKITVGDSKEGWVTALEQYLEVMTGGIDGVENIYIDLSRIRPKGTPLKTFGGTASGFQSVKEMFEKLHSVITEGAFSHKPVDGKLEPIHCLDICNIVGNNVVCGGVRRTAEIAIISPDDKECVNAKRNLTPDKFHRFMSNNSVYLEHKPSKESLAEIFASIKECGEPGFINVKAAKKRREDFAGCNPCVFGDTLITIKENDKVKDVEIQSVVGKEVTVWNGWEWSKVIPNITGYNQPMLEISFSNGSKLKCTDYHRFLVEECYDRVKAKDLKIGFTIKHFMDIDGYLKENIKITGIKRIENAEKVYCFTEPINHTGVFNGIMTGQCGEVLLPPNAVCNLTTINLMAFVDENGNVKLDELKEACILSARAGFRMTNVELELLHWNEVHHRDRLTGCSLTGYQDFIATTNPSNDEECHFLEILHTYTRDAVDEYANSIGVNKPKLATALKPEGCIDSRHLRTLDEGIYNIDELCEDIKSKETGFYDVNGYSFLGNNVPKVYKNDVKKCITFKLRNGRLLTITPSHPMSVNGEWIKAENLEIGDRLDFKLGYYTKETNAKLKDTVLVGHRSDAKDYKTPKEINPELAYLLGAYFANGCFTTNERIKFQCQHLPVHKMVQKLWKKLFDVDTHIIKSTDCDSYTQDFGSVKIREWITENGLDKYRKDGTMRIPLAVRTSSKESILAFIVGYADNNGCFAAKSFSIDSEDEYFMRHMQETAEAVGISFGLSINKARSNSHSKKPMYKLVFSKTYTSQEIVDYINSISVKAHMKGNIEHSDNITHAKFPYEIEDKWYTEPIDTYDIEVDNIHWYYQGCLVSHNTLSLISNAVSPGIHFQHSQYFIRRIRVNASDPLAKTAVALGWRIHPEVGQTMNNATTLVIDFPCHSPSTISKNDVSAVKQLDIYRMFQKHYTEQNTSNTITVKPYEWEDVTNYVYDNWEDILAVTFLATDGKNYPLMPYEECTKEEYEELKSKMKKFDPEILNNMEITTRNFGQEFEILDDRTECASGVCPIR